ncbi:MAG: amino acid racemase [Rubrivivax sp.]
MAGDGVVGVLGGMGPLATIDFVAKLRAATPARTDQQHVPLVVSCIPQVPDRTAAFRGEGPSPLPALQDSGRRLVAAGAGLVVMSCNTAHLWFDELQASLGVPMLHLVDAALEDALARVGARGRIGLLATDATLASGLYLNRRPPCAPQGLHWLLPTAAETSQWLMPGIAAVKAAQEVEAAALLGAAAQALVRRGADALVLGCTELPLALDAARAGVPVVDAATALARRAVRWSMAQREQAVDAMPA